MQQGYLKRGASGQDLAGFIYLFILFIFIHLYFPFDLELDMGSGGDKIRTLMTKVELA